MLLGPRAGEAAVTPRTLVTLLGLMLSAARPALAQGEAAIATGSPGSTALRFGEDMASLAARFGVALEVVPTPGGVASLEALAQRPGTLLAIVPSDVLDFVATFADEPDLRPLAEPMLALPLYREEAHVLARAEIRTLADLAGRRVAVGAPGSSALLTATLLLGTAGVVPAEELRIGGEAALDALRSGRVDAMIEIVGQPAALLKAKVAIEDALHLVPVDDPALRRLYPAATIPASAYHPWQRRDVPTVAAQALLLTRRLAAPGEEAACRLVGRIARIVVDNLGQLRRDGHPKWQEVSPGAAPAAGLERSPCVAQALAGPESYALGSGEALPTPAPTQPAPAPAPAPPSGAAPGNCAAESDPILRRLCEVRPLLRSPPGP